MSKITNDSLTRSGTRCFIAEPIWQQRVSKGYSIVLPSSASFAVSACIICICVTVDVEWIDLVTDTSVTVTCCNAVVVWSHCLAAYQHMPATSQQTSEHWTFWCRFNCARARFLFLFSEIFAFGFQLFYRIKNISVDRWSISWPFLNVCFCFCIVTSFLAWLFGFFCCFWM